MSYDPNQAPQFVPPESIAPETIQQVVNYGGNHELGIWLGARILTASRPVMLDDVVSEVYASGADWIPIRKTVISQTENMQLGDIVHVSQQHGDVELSPQAADNETISAQAVVFGYLSRYSLSSGPSVQKIFGITPSEPRVYDMGLRQTVLRMLAGDERGMKPLAHYQFTPDILQARPGLHRNNVGLMIKKLIEAELVSKLAVRRYAEFTLHPDVAKPIRALLIGLDTLQTKPNAHVNYDAAVRNSSTPRVLTALLNKAGAAKGLI